MEKVVNFIQPFSLFDLRCSQPVHVPPIYLHSFASFSNVISSWCQYEALKYVSFPVQVVSRVLDFLIFLHNFLN